MMDLEENVMDQQDHEETETVGYVLWRAILLFMCCDLM
jgi:hypothetical protein